MNAFNLNDVVVPAPDAGWPKGIKGKRYVVTDVPGGRRKNYKAVPCDADGNRIGGQGINAPEYSIVALGDSTSGAVVTEYVPNPPTCSLVRVKAEHRARYKTDDSVFVVFGETDHERVRISKVGGENGRYWRAFSRHLDVLDPAAAQEALANV